MVWRSNGPIDPIHDDPLGLGGDRIDPKNAYMRGLQAGAISQPAPDISHEEFRAAEEVLNQDDVNRVYVSQAEISDRIRQSPAWSDEAQKLLSQHDGTAEESDLFRSKYRVIMADKQLLIDAINSKASELYRLIEKVSPLTPAAQDAQRVARTKLAEAIMWAIKGLIA